MKIKEVIEKLKKAGFKSDPIFPSKEKLAPITKKEEISYFRKYRFEKNNFLINFETSFEEFDGNDEFAYGFWIKNKKTLKCYFLDEKYKANIDEAIDYCIYLQKEYLSLFLERDAERRKQESEIAEEIRRKALKMLF